MSLVRAVEVVSMAIVLVNYIKERCEEVDDNRSESFKRLNKVHGCLNKLHKHLVQLPQELQEDLLEFQEELQAIHDRLGRLSENVPNASKNSLIRAIKDFWDADDFQKELAELYKDIRECHDNIQTWSSIGISKRLCEIERQQENIKSDIQKILNNLGVAQAACLSPSRQCVLTGAGIDLRGRTTQAGSSDGLAQCFDISTTDLSASPASTLIGDDIQSIQSNSSLSTDEDLPQESTHDSHGLMSSIQSQLNETNCLQVSGLSETVPHSFKLPAEDLKQEIDLVSKMESVGEITDLEGFFMLLRLARLSRDGGMGKETSQIYDSASQVCGRLTKKADPEMLYELAMLLYDIFANLAIRGYTEDAKTVLQEVKKVRRQLVKNGQETDVAKLAGYLDGISSKLKKIRCSEAAALAKHEARRCRANEKAGWAQGEKQVLSQLQMETLFQAPYSPKSFKRYSIA